MPPISTAVWPLLRRICDAASDGHTEFSCHRFFCLSSSYEKKSSSVQTCLNIVLKSGKK